MAKNASIETNETALLGDPANGAISGPSAEFDALIAWILTQEAENATVRVHKILTKDNNAPEFIRLQYSYPAVEVGELNGYAKGDGSIVMFDPK